MFGWISCINNAGIMFPPYSKTVNGFENQFERLNAMLGSKMDEDFKSRTGISPNQFRKY